MFRSVVALVFCGACVGVVGEPGAEGGRTSPRDPSTSAPREDARFRPAPAGLRALTRAQYVASVREVLGVSSSDDAPIVELGNWDSSIAARSGVASPTLVEHYADHAFALAAWVVAPERRARFVPCEPTGSADDPCVTTVLDTIGRRAFRGRLLVEERGTWTSLAHDAAVELDDPWAGVEHVIAGLLQSPRFLYRLELTVDGEEEERSYGDHAMATRLAYLVWGSTPDDTLLDAADTGALSDDDGLARSIERMLADPRAEHGLRAFLDELFETHRVLDATRTSDAHPEFARDRAALHESFLRTAVAAVHESGLAGLYDVRRAVVNRETAAYLGLDSSGIEGFVERELTDRAGVLAMPAFLAATANEHSTSATRRGLFVRRRLLCGVVAPPPSDIDTTLPEDVTSGPSTARMRLAAHQEKGTVCYDCHARMDPLGLALERFDQVGAFRTHEQGLPIDPSGELDRSPFADELEFAESMAAHPSALPCLAGRTYEMGTGVAITSSSTELEALAAATWPELIRALATHPSFRHAWGDPR